MSDLVGKLMFSCLDTRTCKGRSQYAGVIGYSGRDQTCINRTGQVCRQWDIVFFSFLQFVISYAWSLLSDYEKIPEIERHTLVLPLGSGALAGNPFRIDRNFLCEGEVPSNQPIRRHNFNDQRHCFCPAELGFQDVTRNSLYGVSDRDFVGKLIPEIYMSTRVKAINFSSLSWFF